MALKPCHECGKEISDQAKTCPHCGAPVKQKWEEWLEKKAVEGRAGWKRKAGKKEWGVFIIVLIGFIAYVVYTTNHPSKSSTSTSPSSSTSVGSEARLYVAGTQSVWLAIDEKAFDEFIKAGVAKDKIGLANLIATGGIFSVDNNTKVLVLEHKAFTGSKVRVLEGKNIGLAGWVAYEYVKSY